MAWITGNATWYDSCCNGPGCRCENHQCTSNCGCGGACGNCDNNANHVAWPNLSTTGCNFHCGTNPAKGCGATIYVYDRCTGTGAFGVIRDCCPCKEAGCNKTPRCNGVPDSSGCCQVPLVDLTQAYFLAIHGGLADGRIAVDIWVEG